MSDPDWPPLPSESPYSERAEIGLMAFEERLDRGEFDYLFKDPKWHIQRKQRLAPGPKLKRRKTALKQAESILDSLGLPPDSPYSVRSELAELAYMERYQNGEMNRYFKNPRFHRKQK